MNFLTSEMKEKELNEITVQIQDARRQGQTATVARLQQRQAELTGAIKKQDKDDSPMRTRISEELTQLKKEKLELEARRQMFLDRQSAPKQP